MLGNPSIVNVFFLPLNKLNINRFKYFFWQYIFKYLMAEVQRIAKWNP